jgi:hypothetical protein
MSLELLQLVNRYRDVGRPAEAVDIEQRLRRQLALADPEFPLVQELQRCKQRSSVLQPQ